MGSHGAADLGFADLHEDFFRPFFTCSTDQRHDGTALHLLGDGQTRGIYQGWRQINEADELMNLATCGLGTFFLFLEPILFEAAAETLETMGYKAVEPDDIDITVWSEAMAESQPPDTTALFKKLREDRVLRPV